MSDDFIDKEEQNEENIPTPENGHLDYKPADTKNTGVKHQLSGMYQNWFLDYASYVILERAVPHINDGLKPVQRRILHSMKRLDDGRYNKVANIVGHTMQFHPHGDASIGDALVQLGQKDLLIDCQGNWGNDTDRRRCRCPPLYRSTSVQIRIGCGFQSQNHRMASIIRRTKQRADHPTCQIPTLARSGSRRYCCGPFFQNPATQF